jgi:hypothetical protein
MTKDITKMTDTAPESVSHLPADVRLELLVGHLSDLLSPARELTGALRLKANASVTTRGQLDHLIGLSGSIWERLGAIREEIAGMARLDD